MRGQAQRRRAAAVAVAVVAFTISAVTPARAQEEEARAVRPSLTVELYGGGAGFGRFVEQHVGPPPTFQRELTAAEAFALGGSLGLWPWAKTSVRLAVTYAPTELEYRDDTGTGSKAGDQEHLADLSALVFSGEVMRFLVDSRRRLAPYATGGVAVVRWGLADQQRVDDISAVHERQTRLGALGGVGLQVRLGWALATRLELNSFALGNPFDGRDSYLTTTGTTFDEPSTVWLTRITLGLTYTRMRP